LLPKLPHLQSSQPHSMNSEANTLFPCDVPGHTPKARSSSSEARRCSERRTPPTPGTEIRTKLAHFCIFQYRSYCLSEWDVLLSLFNIAVRTKRKLCVPECSVLSAIVIYSSVLSPVLSYTIHLLEFLLWQYLANSPMPVSFKKVSFFVFLVATISISVFPLPTLVP